MPTTYSQHNHSIQQKPKKPIFIEYKSAFLIGRGERIRTSDPLHPMQVRYQAALRPEFWFSIYTL
jgi:hypothetical protein